MGEEGGGGGGGRGGGGTSGNVSDEPSIGEGCEGRARWGGGCRSPRGPPAPRRGGVRGNNSRTPQRGRGGGRSPLAPHHRRRQPHPTRQPTQRPRPRPARGRGGTSPPRPGDTPPPGKPALGRGRGWGGNGGGGRGGLGRGRGAAPSRGGGGGWYRAKGAWGSGRYAPLGGHSGCATHSEAGGPTQTRRARSIDGGPPCNRLQFAVLRQLDHRSLATCARPH